MSVRPSISSPTLVCLPDQVESDYLWFRVRLVAESVERLGLLAHGLSFADSGTAVLEVDLTSGRDLSFRWTGSLDGLSEVSRQALPPTQRALGSDLLVAEAAYRTVPSLVMIEAHARGYSRLHGALVSREGRHAALLGPSGAGKTGLAVRLAEQGFRVLGDEGILVREGKVLPLPRRLHVKQGDRTNLPDDLFVDSTPLPYPTPIWPVDPGFWGGAPIQPARLNHMIWLGDGDADARREALTMSAALPLVLRDAEGYTSHAEPSMVTRSRLVAQTSRLLDDCDAVTAVQGHHHVAGQRLVAELVV